MRPFGVVSQHKPQPIKITEVEVVYPEPINVETVVKMPKTQIYAYRQESKVHTIDRLRPVRPKKQPPPPSPIPVPIQQNPIPIQQAPPAPPLPIHMVEKPRLIRPIKPLNPSPPINPLAEKLIPEVIQQVPLQPPPQPQNFHIVEEGQHLEDSYRHQYHRTLSQQKQEQMVMELRRNAPVEEFHPQNVMLDQEGQYLENDPRIRHQRVYRYEDTGPPVPPPQPVTQLKEQYSLQSEQYEKDVEPDPRTKLSHKRSLINESHPQPMPQMFEEESDIEAIRLPLIEPIILQKDPQDQSRPSQGFESNGDIQVINFRPLAPILI